jgi:hypothetical protein
MHFGIQLPHFGPLASAQGTIDLARRAEELGFDSVAGGRLAPQRILMRFIRDVRPGL